MRSLALVLMAISFSAIGESVTRAQILNGSFESPVVSTLNIAGLGLSPGSQVFTPGTGITSWTISGGDVSIVDAGSTLTSLLGLFTANSGNQYAVLNGLNINILGVVSQTGTAGTLTQTFTTTPGKSYQISFAYRGLTLGALDNNTVLDVGVSNSTASTLPTGGAVSVNLALGWQTETFQFTATGTSSALSFAQDTSGTNLGLISLDSVTLTALPEPVQEGAAAVAFLGLLIVLRLVGNQLRAKGPAPASA